MTKMEMDGVAEYLDQICSLFQLTMEAVEKDDVESDPRLEENRKYASAESLNAMFAGRVRNVYVPALNAVYGALYNLRKQVIESL